MPRRREIPKRELAADPLYGSILVSKFINTVMYDGKRSTAERILYKSFELIKERTSGDDPLKVFKKALDNVKPSLEVASGWWVELPGADRGHSQPTPVAQHPMACQSGAFTRRRQDDGRKAGKRATGRVELAGRRREEARRHAPHGGSE
jgi:hypothetical protein